KLEDFQLEDKDAKFDDDLETKVVAAVRLEKFGDMNLAHTRWLQIAENLKGFEDRRPVFIMARGRVHELDANKGQPKDAAERTALITKEVTRAKALLQSSSYVDKRTARNILRDVRDLYAGESGDI